MKGARSAEIVFRCSAFHETIAALEALGFRLDTIMPADDPSVAILSGHGTRFRLERSDDDEARAGLRLVSTDPSPMRPPTASSCSRAGAILVEIETDDQPGLGSLPTDILVTPEGAATWKVGRASMHYRDLIPDRLGGRVIASHIRIPEGGPVPDYVHYHDVRFQLIHCYRGWVRLVYEDQGDPFVLEAGETVLQPPKIRHRVLESSPGLEVVELGSPAFHPTHTDHEMTLPTPTRCPQRDFDGQRFLASRAGFSEATRGAVDVRVLGPSDRSSPLDGGHHLFGFVRDGAMTLRSSARTIELHRADAFVVPPTATYSLVDATPDLSWLEITMLI